MMRAHFIHTGKCHQKGAVAAELAVTMVVFIGLVVAIIEFARIMYVFNAAAEATRLGARLSATCGTDSTVKSLVNSNILNIGTDKYLITNDTTTAVNTCNASNSSDCQPTQLVSFQIQFNSKLSTFDWFIPDILIPTFTTTIPVEFSGC